MAENVQRSKGRAQNYKLDRGGQASEGGPFIGVVVNNVDNTRQGRLQVAIGEFGAVNKDGTPNLTDKSLWRTVSYCPPFYGATPIAQAGTSAGVGTYPGNRNTYGMWFTPPDLGVQVLCFFVNGDPNQGYYVGCIPDPGQNHMVPAIGATANYVTATGNKNQETYFANSKLLPVAEINSKNEGIADNPKFFDQKKPVHAFAAAVLFQQGLQDDPVRGSIGSSSQRESPSSCYGISTPGRAIFQGGSTDATIKKDLDSGASTAAIGVIGRRTGHTFVMDDGNLAGADNLIRIRTGKGHQITMSDDGNCFYICHANGQTWVELGQEGTLDVFSTNSINLRTEGTINLHADKDINMFAGETINMKSKKAFSIQSDDELSIACKKAMTLFTEGSLGLKTNTKFAVKAKAASIDGGAALSLKAILISLNGGPTFGVDAPKGLTKYVMPDTSFNNSTGWAIAPDGLESIVTRAPTHEPWPYHNQGISVKVNLENGQPSLPPGAPPLPDGVKVTKTGDAAKKLALQQQLVNEQAELIKDQALKDKIIADNRPDATAFLIEIDKVIADRQRLIQFTQQEIAKL
jgi:hypothetical protein